MRRVLVAVAVFTALLTTTSSAPQDATSFENSGNIREAFFNGSAFLILESTVSVHRHSGLSFRTCDGGKLFTQHYGSDFITLEVNNEGLLFIAIIDQQRYEAKLNAKLLNNAWHNVNLVFRLGNLTLSSAGNTQVIANATYNSAILNLPEYNVNGSLIIGEDFKGCILQGPGILFRPNETVNNGAIFGSCPLDSKGCGPYSAGGIAGAIVSTTDFCHHGPCMMHGTCISRQDRYECHCYARYSGNNCQLDNGPPCDSSPCRNGGTCTEDSGGNYSCMCNPGYTGTLCESHAGISQCDPNPCKNDGICKSVMESEYKCECTPGWMGKNCEININECASNPCRHGGTCIDGINNYTCRCDRTGYEGGNCEINIDECLNNPCLNKGECFDNYGGYICQCPMGFEGQNCELNLNECLSIPCLNGGTCIDDVGSYHCLCPPGFTSRHCELHGLCKNAFCPANSICIEDIHGPQCVCKPGFIGIPPNCTINFCTSNPCMNGGSCTSNKDGFNCTCPPEWKGSTCKAPASDWCSACMNGGTCNETIHGIMCQCPRFWTGPQCEQQITCKDAPCKQIAACHDYPGGYYCNCEAGWTGPDCSIDLDECASDPCRNGANCIDQLNSYYCQCPPGYTGKNCQINIDECLSQPCQNGGICIDKINGYTCNCTRDFMGDNCEREYDACAINPCMNNGTCTLVVRSRRDYVCECPPGFKGKVCDINVDECIGAKCPDDRICVDAIAGYECKCRDGYRGPNCTLIVDHCASNPCNNGTCKDLGDTFKCQCKDGYEGITCDKDVNECETKGTSLCNNGICVNKEGGYDCFCRPGFSGDHCDMDIDECLCGPCKNNATCLDKINSFECMCPLGYAGKTCDIDVNECESNPCQNGATCMDHIAAYSCICSLGFTGYNCETNIDDCKSSPCQNNGQCIDGINNYTCDCTDTGFEGSHCENNIDDCLPAPCANGATCVDDIKTYICQCYPGYTGPECQIDIDECESTPCQFNGTCLERSNQELYKSDALTLPSIFTQTSFSYANASGYECICVQGVEGRNCEININECESSPCVAGTCVDRIGGYKCECDKGFEGDRCESDINECERYLPCAHGTCTDGRADYFCTCESEFGGKNCSVPLIGCQGNACHNGGTCWPYLTDETEHKFNCTCPNGFHGEICDHVTTMSLRGSSYVMVNTTRDEGYDIQFRFRTTLPNGLIAMGKGSTFYILELVNGKLNLHSSILNRWEGVFIGSGLNDSNWQKVFVAINTTHVVLSANEEQTIYPINLNEGNTSHTSFTTTFVGGTISNLRKLAHGPPFFVGCTEDVVINGEWVYTGLSSKTVSMEDVEPGCPREEQCLPNPCRNGGHCTDRWRDFSCKCERPYLGHTCQYNMTAATFGYGNITDGYVTVKVTDMARRAIRSIVDISMFIRTRQDTGDIFYLGSESSTQFDGKQEKEKPYIRALLEHGELLVKIQFNGSEAYAVGGVKLNEGNYHLIQVVRNVTLVQVKINGTEYFRKTIGATGQSNVTVLYLGGLPQASRYSRQADSRQMEVQQSPQVNFKGIIQDVQISNGSKTMVVEFYPLSARDIPTPIEFGSVTFDREKVLEGVVSDPVCTSNPCHHNGTCHVTWNDFWCKCPRGYTGKMCQEMEFCQLQDCPNGSRCQNLDDGYECIANATFDGIDDLFTYTYEQTEQQNITESTISNIEITYQSRTGGVLMHIASRNGDQNFVVSVFKDNITISWNLDIDNRGTISFGKNVPDGNWTSIVIKLNNDSIESGYANSNDETIPHVSPNFSFSLWYELLTIGTVTLGGLGGDTYDRNSYENVGTDNTFKNGITIDGNSVDFPDHLMTTAIPLDSIVSGDAFRGCLGEVRIGPMLLHYFTFEEVYRNANFTPKEYLALQVADNVSNHENIGCRLCFDNDCKNGGHCLSEATSYKCECLPGYIEDDCSIDEDDCQNNECKNGATCVDAVAYYNCECPNGWQGRFCDTDIDECGILSPCHNNGSCVNHPGSFSCDCLDQFTGDTCESFKLITCENHPCRNGSTCIDVVNLNAGNNFTCHCAPDFEGTLCKTPYCIANKCQYGGSCVDLDQNPHCTCPLGYTGRYCETNIDDCAIVGNGTNPCKNRGKCIDEVNSFTCDCSGTGYYGVDCSIDEDECTDPKFNVKCGNGQCQNLPGKYECVCDYGYCGDNCTIIDPCIEEPCQNQGTCECQGDSSYICHCISDYKGVNCTQQERSLGSQALDIAVIVGPIVGCLLLIGAGSLIALFMMARKKRATRGTYSPSAQEFSNPRVEMDNVMKPPPEERLI